MSRNYKAVIPVAGIGTRLRPHTYSMPKPLIPVAGRPMLAHILDPLEKQNPDEVIFVVGHLKEQLIEFVKQNYSFKSTFITQTDLLGLGFAVHLAIKDIDDSEVLVILGDTITKLDLGEFIGQGGNILGVKKVNDPSRFGIAVLKNKRISELEEKPENPRSDLAIIGLYYFQSSDSLKKNLEKLIQLDKRTRGEIQLTDAMEFMIQDGIDFKPFIVDGWYDCGKKETLLDTNQKLLPDEANVKDYNGSTIIPPVFIAPDAEIKNSVIGPYVSISENARIDGAVIKNSIIFENARVEKSVLNESLIGCNAVVKGYTGSLNIGDTSFTG